MRLGRAKAVRGAIPFLAAAALWLAPIALNPTSVAFWRGGAYSDLLISHWPNALLLHRGLFDAGRIPLWNPTILSGTPFAADPLSGLWYLPNWAAAFHPAPITFNLLFWLHLAWAGWGAARLARREGAGTAGALVSGLSFGGAPRLIGHVGLGHLGLVEAVCWSPWVMIAAGHAAEALADDQRSWLPGVAGAGSILGVVFLADPRWAVPAAMAGIAYAVVRIARSHQSRAAWPSPVRLAASAGTAAAFALGISACLAIPLGEFVRLSTRASLTASEMADLSLPWERLATLVVPDFGAWPEWLAYAGVVVVLLSALAFGGSARRAFFWWVLALVGGLLALGPALPVYPLAALLIPGISLLRVPARFLFLTTLGLSIAAGLGTQTVLTAGENARSRRKALWIGIAVTVGVVGVAAWQSDASGGSVLVRARSLTATALAVLGLMWLVLMLRGTIHTRVGTAGWAFLISADLALMGIPSLRMVSSGDILQDRASLIEALAQPIDAGRVLSPSYSLHQPSATLGGLELADGIDPLQLASYRDFMSGAMGFSAQDYSVTLPPYPDGDPSKAWLVKVEAERLGWLNVTHVVSEFPLTADGLVLETSQEGAYVYRNRQARPRAWVQPSSDAMGAWAPVDHIVRSIDELHIQVKGPGMLVASEIAYPGWLALLDGKRVPIETVHGMLRAVEIPEGGHLVEFAFRPTSVYVGAGLSLLTWMALVVVWRTR